jgi:hypothetical protein
VGPPPPRPAAPALAPSGTRSNPSCRAPGFISPAQEYYEFIESESSDVFSKLGTFAWLAMAIAFVETLAVVKFGAGLFPQPWPRRVLLAWGSVAAVFAVVFGTWCVRFYALEPRRGKAAAGRAPRAKRA